MLIIKTWMRVIIIFCLNSFPGLALAFSLKDGAEAYTTIIETHHRLNNMYFYGAMSLLVMTIPALSKIRQGSQMRPGLSKALTFFIHTVNFTAILFLVIHFMPETETIFDWGLGLLGRIFE